LRWSAVRLAPRQLVFDHLRQVVIAIVMLEDLDQLDIGQGLKGDDPSVIGVLIQVDHAAPLSCGSSLGAC
jgi:hypothetical protein